MPISISTAGQERVLLKPREAASTLGISERQLWTHTSPRGAVPCVKIGGCVRYSPVALQAYIDGQALPRNQ